MKPGLKNPLLRVTNLLLYLSFCALIGTGALLTWKLVPGSRGGRGLKVLGMERHDWGDIHFWCGVVCLVATIVHMLLNWQWLKKIATSGHLWRLVAGLGVGLGIIWGIYFMPMTQKQGPGRDGHAEEAVEHVDWLTDMH
jgi:hypothetical protein